MPPKSYDDARMEAVLVTCPRCGQSFYHTGRPLPVCLACEWPVAVEDRPPERRHDVSGNWVEGDY